MRDTVFQVAAIFCFPGSSVAHDFDLWQLDPFFPVRSYSLDWTVIFIILAFEGRAHGADGVVSVVVALFLRHIISITVFRRQRQLMRRLLYHGLVCGHAVDFARAVKCFMITFTVVEEEFLAYVDVFAGVHADAMRHVTKHDPWIHIPKAEFLLCIFGFVFRGGMVDEAYFVAHAL